MSLLHYLWSKTAASNATADANINWQEGQAPSSVNDSARSMMASLAGYRDDIAGAIVTGGTSTNYTLSSNQIFDTLAHMSGQMIAFSPHATNGATVTLNVDGLGAKPLRSAPSVELSAGVLIQGSPYVALYNNSDAVWYLSGFYANSYNVPLLGGMDYWDTIAPNSSFIFPAGQAISRSTYASAFARWGTTYGVGDGSTTFNVPDKTGRVSAMKEASATRLTTAGSGIDGATMGAAAGAQNRSLAANQIPTITSVNFSQAITVTAAGNIPIATGAWANNAVGSGPNTGAFTSGSVGNQAAAISGNNSISVAYTNSSQVAVITAQPTIVCNYIIRVL